MLPIVKELSSKRTSTGRALMIGAFDVADGSPISIMQAVLSSDERAYESLMEHEAMEYLNYRGLPLFDPHHPLPSVATIPEDSWHNWHRLKFDLQTTVGIGYKANQMLKVYSWDADRCPLDFDSADVVSSIYNIAYYAAKPWKEAELVCEVNLRWNGVGEARETVGLKEHTWGAQLLECFLKLERDLEEKYLENQPE